MRLIRALHGADQTPASTNSPRLSLTQIRSLTGASMGFIKLALSDPRALMRRGCLCRYCPDDDLTSEEVNYLCDERTLVSWRTFSLLQRTKLFRIRFLGRKLSVGKLRKVYRLNKIKLRSLKFN